jgi:hypothetical protein
MQNYEPIGAAFALIGFLDIEKHQILFANLEPPEPPFSRAQGAIAPTVADRTLLTSWTSQKRTRCCKQEGKNGNQRHAFGNR